MAISKVKVRCVTRYELLRQLGQGSLTRVYLAALRNEGESPALLVLKLMRKELAKNKDLRALFLDQAAATLQLRHPNIVQTHDVVADAEACGLSMEFLEGQPLRQVLERVGRRSVPLDVHLRVLCKVLDALHYAHTFTGPGSQPNGVVHRDVSPSNVFITYDGQVKLLGTGFAQARIALEQELGRRLPDIGYAAPELLLGYSAGPSADLFGVGVMLWEALACARRTEGDTAKVVVHQRTRGEERDIERVRPDAPPGLVQICRRALAVSPRERYASAGELKADLEAYLVGAGATDTGLSSLRPLMTSYFSPELNEMRLFIGAGFGQAERFVPAPPEMVVRGGPAELLSEGDWNDETHVVAPLAERKPPSPPPVSKQSLPARDPDTGGHRAFSASLAPQQAAGRTRYSRLAWPVATALGAVLTLAALARWTQSEPDDVSASETLSLHVESGPSASDLANEPDTAGPAAMPGGAHARGPEALAPEAPAPQALAPDVVVPTPLDVSSAARDAGSTDAGEGIPTLPSAFLALAPGEHPSEAEEANDPDVSFMPNELPLVDDERELLQESIVAAARARQRAAAARRARPRKLIKPLQVQRVSGGAVPRPIDESDPYDPRAYP